MAKTDIKSTFRIIPVHPLEYPLLSIKWDNEYYFDRCLAMGLKSSCAFFEKFSSSLEWLATQHLHVSAVIHILDDFLFIAPTKDKCSTDLHNFLAMCKFLGVPIANEKTVGPNTTFTICWDRTRFCASGGKVAVGKAYQISHFTTSLLSEMLSYSPRAAVFNRPVEFLLFSCCPRPCLFTRLNRSY